MMYVVQSLVCFAGLLWCLFGFVVLLILKAVGCSEPHQVRESWSLLWQWVKVAFMLAVLRFTLG